MTTQHFPEHSEHTDLSNDAAFELVAAINNKGGTAYLSTDLQGNITVIEKKGPTGEPVLLPVYVQQEGPRGVSRFWLPAIEMSSGVTVWDLARWTENDFRIYKASKGQG